MKRFLYIIGVLACAVVAFWAYSISAKTRAATSELAYLQSEIEKEYERIATLRSEWAYLNRPERLRHLVEINFEKLGLVQITEQNYAQSSVVPFASEEELNALPAIDGGELAEVIAQDVEGGN